MNLEEIREIVDFMKETGLSELEYSEKNTSIKLKLAPPSPMSMFRPRKAAEEAVEAVDAEVAEAAENDEVTKAAAEAAAAAASEVKKAAIAAAAAVSERVKSGADAAAEYLKAKRDERLAGTPGAFEVTFAEADEPAPFLDEEDEEEEAPAPEIPEEDDEEEVEEVKLDTESAKTAVSKTGEIITNAAKAGFALGKAGVKRGAGLLSSMFKSKEDEDDIEIEVEITPDEKKTEEE